MPEYTLLTLVAVVAVVAAELIYFKSGIFATAQYWWTMLIIFAFQIPVDGWLTKLSAPIVIYNPDEIFGLRAPWDIPIEDFGFGSPWSRLILLWRRWGDRRSPPGEVDRRVEDVLSRRTFPELSGRYLSLSSRSTSTSSAHGGEHDHD